MIKATAYSAHEKTLKHKRRFCKVSGCERIVKSQGLCQRHGAKPRKCKVESCPKQAQGNFDGMCKSHFKALKAADPLAAMEPSMEAEKSSPPPPPSGESVYDCIIPESIAWCPPEGRPVPLVAHLKAGFDAGKPPAWHRNEERRARGLWPVTSPATQLEAWERELVWTEILILTGNSQTSFRHLARAWGRDKGFQTVLAQFICERKGSVERKTKNSNAQQRPLGQLPTCVEITHNNQNYVAGLDHDDHDDPSHEGSTTTSGSASGEENAECATGEAWEESYYNDLEGNNTDMRRTEEVLAADIFMFPSSHQNQFASFQFDSAMLAEIDREAEAIIASDDENQDNQRRHPI